MFGARFVTPVMVGGKKLPQKHAPALPSDVLRMIWQRVWRLRAAIAIQRMYRGYHARTYHDMPALVELDDFDDM